MALREDGRMERPILFSGEMVRAILDGRKTQTRRVVKPQPEHGIELIRATIPWFAVIGYGVSTQPGMFGPVDEILCPYGQPGDLLWVKETFALFETEPGRNAGHIHYRTTFTEDGAKKFKWKSPRFMPRKASRILLEVVSVRVERVQEISEEDARAEGVDREFACLNFISLWDSINGKKPGRSWADNPWVWVVEFKRVEA